MSRPLRRWASLLAALAACSPALGAFTDLDVPPPDIKAPSYLLLDALTGTVIAERDADVKRPPASLTKMMTAYIAFAAVAEGVVGLDELVTVSPSARNANGSRMFLESGSQVTMHELLLGLIVQSGNDAAVAIAERIGGSEAGFAELMNQQAGQLGMENSRFANSTGLPAKGQVSTARDLAILGSRLALDYPELYSLHAVDGFEHNGIAQNNRNRLLSDYRGADGIKTGYTRAAGYCLAGSAVRHGMRLVGVIMKSSSPRQRALEMARLFDHGFNNFRSVELFEPGQQLDEVKVWGGQEERVLVGYGDQEPLRLFLPRGKANQLKAVLELAGNPVEAPVSAGDQIARIKVSAGDEVLATLPAVALHEVQEGPWWEQLTAYVRLHWLAPEPQ